MHILFIAPVSNLDTATELTSLVRGNLLEPLTGPVDRAGLERALKAAQYDVLHFAGHGGKGVLGLTDGLLDAADLATMCEVQKRLRFIVVNACDSLALAATLHNTLHVPVIAHDDEISDAAAKRFVETFYRAYKQTVNVSEAFDRAMRTVGRLFNGEANTPVLINGDMVTDSDLSDCMAYVKEEIGAMRGQLNTIEADVAELKGKQPRTLWMLLTLLLLAQLITPWLNHLFGG